MTRLRIASAMAIVTLLGAYLLLTGAVILAASPAEAARVRVPVASGKQESLHEIMNIDLKGPNGEELYLGYKTTHYIAILPYAISDDGYILGVRGGTTYYKLDPDKLQALQAAGYVPNPLPKYEIPLLDYVTAHAIWSLPILLLLWIGFRRRSKQREAQAVAVFASAETHHRNNNLDGAITEYSKAIGLVPKFAAAYLNRAYAYRSKGLPDKAVADFSTLLRIQPISDLVLINRGVTFQSMGRNDAAMADFERAIKHRGSARSYLARADLYAVTGQLDRALADYTTAADRDPELPQIFIGRSRVLNALGRTQEAQADHRSAETLLSQRTAVS